MSNTSHQDAWHEIFHSLSTSDHQQPSKISVHLGENGTLVIKKNPALASLALSFLSSPQETQANHNAHQSFQSALEKKYGPDIAAFAFAKSTYKEGAPLSLRKINQILTIASTAQEIKLLNDQADYLKHDLQEIYETLQKTSNDACEAFHPDHLSSEERSSIFSRWDQSCRSLQSKTRDLQRKISNLQSEIHSQGAKGPQVLSREELKGLQKKFKTLEEKYLALEKECQQLHLIDEITPEHDDLQSAPEGLERREPRNDFPRVTRLSESRQKILKNLLDRYENYVYLREIDKTNLTALQASYDPNTFSHRACNGIRGLPNATGNCGINSATQLLKSTLQSMRDDCDDRETQEQSKKISAYLQKKMPSFHKFFMDEPMTAEDYQDIHREIARALTEDYFYSVLSGIGISPHQRDTGYFYGSQEMDVLSVLLYRCDVPPVSFEHTKNLEPKDRWQVVTLEQSQDAAQTTPSTIDQILRAQLEKESRQLGDPIPRTLCLHPNIQTVGQVGGMLEPIILPHKDKGSITYEPIGIQCTIEDPPQPIGHAVAFIKKDGLWNEVNDGGVSPIPKEWEDSFSDFFSGSRRNSYATNIIYGRKKEHSEEVAPSSYEKNVETGLKLENIRHDENWSFVKWQDNENRKTSGSEMSAEENTLVESWNDMELPIPREQVEKEIQFWTQRIQQCQKGLENAPPLYQPYWRHALELAQHNQQNCT